MATHDYVIANGTGAAVRSDLNDALAAIVSQNSSATAPATTFAYMRWADTTAGVMKMRNGANNAWISLYQLDGEYTTIAIENGTAAAPAFYFKDSGTDTGIYSSGADALDFSTGGTRRLGIGSAGDVTVYTGNVTINAQGDLRFADSDSSNWVAFQAPATVASNVTWTLPSADGTSGQLLSTDGSGTLSFTNSIIKSGTAVASTSGTSIDFTGLPSWVKRVTVMFDGVSTNGTSNVLLQIGDSGGIETTGYVSGIANVSATPVTATSTQGYLVDASLSGANVDYGHAFLTNISGNTWVVTSQVNNNGVGKIGNGSKTLSGTLDRVRITTVNGTDQFDAGTVNILYEG